MASFIFTDFLAGETTPKFEGRVTHPVYSHSCRVLENMIVIAQGGAEKRPGTIHVAPTKNNQAARLIPFVKGVEQNYVLEVGSSYIRPYKHGNNSNLTEVVSTWNAAEIGAVVNAQFGANMWLTHRNYPTKKLTTTADATWTLANESFTNGANAIFATANNYPGLVSFFEGRMVLASTYGNLQTFWLSRSPDTSNGAYRFTDFTIGANADHAMELPLSSERVEVIRWLATQNVLLCGTSGGEWRIGDPVTALTPTTVSAKRQSTYGGAAIPPVQVGDSCLFVQRGLRSVREMYFSDNSNSYIAVDRTTWADHITESGIKEIHFQQEPTPIVWLVRKDGVLVSLTFDKENEVFAYARQVTDGAVESMCILPGTGEEDNVYMIVNRTVGNNTVRYIEYMAPRNFGVQNNCFFVDSGITANFGNNANNTVTGLGHLNGETVSVLADGATHPDVTVSNNQVVLDREASVAHVGLHFNATLKPQRIEAGQAEGTAQGKVKRIHKVVVRFFQTLGAKVGASANAARVVPFRTPSDPMDDPPSLYTGDREIDFSGDYEKSGDLVVVSDQPLPMTVLAIVPKLKTYE